eukprot:13067344-Alexandrium_andersonii.AAC.1
MPTRSASGRRMSGKEQERPASINTSGRSAWPTSRPQTAWATPSTRTPSRSESRPAWSRPC